MSLSIKYFFDARKKRKKEWVAEDNYFEKAEGTFTVQYPKESIPIPDVGRYQLHNEIDDCIVCDKCAKICPVDCIDIEPVRSPEVFGKTSDGTPLRIYAAKFDIDMAKCCFCGLCTVVCPTECLTMTKEFDFSTTDILDHNFSFSKMSEIEIAEKKKEFDDYQAEKEKQKSELPPIKKEVTPKPKVAAAKPAMGKPKMAVKPKMMKPKVGGSSEVEGGDTPKQPKPVMKPKTQAKPVMKPKTQAKPVMKPKMQAKPVIPTEDAKEDPKESGGQEAPKSMAKPKPIMKPKIPKKK